MPDDRAATEHFVPMVGQTWNHPVRCPHCAGPVRHKPFPHPRFACADRDCAFRFGWRLRFGSDLRRQPGDRLFAVPYDEGGELCNEAAVPWRPDARMIAQPDSASKADAAA